MSQDEETSDGTEEMTDAEIRKKFNIPDDADAVTSSNKIGKTSSQKNAEDSAAGTEQMDLAKDVASTPAPLTKKGSKLKYSHDGDVNMELGGDAEDQNERTQPIDDEELNVSISPTSLFSKHINWWF